MFLLDWCLESDDEKIEDKFMEDTPIFKDSSENNYNLCNKGPVFDKDDNITHRKITPPATPKLNDPPPSKSNGETNKFVPVKKKEQSTYNSTENNTKFNTIPNNEKTSKPKIIQTMDNTNSHVLL
jgi:hypothetical protein